MNDLNIYLDRSPNYNTHFFRNRCDKEKITETKKEKGQTCKRLGLRTSNLALVLMEVVLNGPANRTEFWTVKLSESIV
jgi:hypothetical protein